MTKPYLYIPLLFMLLIVSQGLTYKPTTAGSYDGFGNNRLYHYHRILRDSYRGSPFICPANGSARYINVILGGWNRTVQAAIYRVSDGQQVGVTDQLNITGGAKWRSLPFSMPYPQLTADTAYYLVASANASTWFALGFVAGMGVYEPMTFGAWPDAVTPTVNDYLLSIYCLYQPDSPVITM